MLKNSLWIILIIGKKTENSDQSFNKHFSISKLLKTIIKICSYRSEKNLRSVDRRSYNC